MLAELFRNPGSIGFHRCGAEDSGSSLLTVGNNRTEPKPRSGSSPLIEFING
jgi:hypothetical protein